MASMSIIQKPLREAYKDVFIPWLKGLFRVDAVTPQRPQWKHLYVHSISLNRLASSVCLVFSSSFTYRCRGLGINGFTGHQSESLLV